MVWRFILAVLLYGGIAPAFAGKYDGNYFAMPQVQYPIYSDEMVAAVGLVDIELEYPVFQSVAIVGADEISAHWLRLNNEYLVRIRAIGIVVHVESEEQLQTLQLWTEVPLFAVSGFSAPLFGNVYPVVVDATAGRVRQ